MNPSPTFSDETPPSRSDDNADASRRADSLRGLLRNAASGLAGGTRALPAFARMVWARHRPWIWMVVALILMALPTLRQALPLWLDPSSPLTFQIFVPLAVALLLWGRREQIGHQYRELLFLYGQNSPKRRGNLWGVAAGCVLLLVSAITATVPLGLFAIVIVVVGTAYYLYGPFLLRSLLLPLSYLLLFVPLPGILLAYATVLLRFGSLLVAGQLLRFFFKNAELRGPYVVFPGFVLSVSEGAGGSTILFPLAAFAIWLAIYRRISLGSSLVLLTISAAISAFATVLRLFVTGAIGAFAPSVGNALQTDGTLWLGSLFLGIIGAALLYKIAVLLSPPRLI